MRSIYIKEYERSATAVYNFAVQIFANAWCWRWLISNMATKVSGFSFDKFI